NGTPPDAVPGKNNRPWHPPPRTRGRLSGRRYPHATELADKQLGKPVETVHHIHVGNRSVVVVAGTAQPHSCHSGRSSTTCVGLELVADMHGLIGRAVELLADPLENRRIGLTHPELTRDRDVVEVTSDPQCAQLPMLVTSG